MANETVNFARVSLGLDVLVTGLDGSKLAPGKYTLETAFSDGTGDGQITQIYYNTDIDGASFTHDLDGLTDFQGGSTSTCTRVKLMYFNNKSTTTSLTIGGGDFSPMFADSTDKLVLPPEADCLIRCRKGGYTLTATSADGLLVVSAAGQTYDMILFLS
jgi:hypothetical protein